ncbi:hypothetical protein THASP1DRAFT_31515 [Thamnocephalis sphaerospora]|uniref:Uricase n=1 Tax=Thamnocephalis sphaerospora TaxID=78915 RepID=A0A4P9XMZ5_9FUNG|nr:hypothetical protein THASP1DRAFT_31515 [Thamnocephalis sphaerospora]|eukprot:RKP06670.1 hypothetical protein THASP1DRAFT_31515 [Thamnocephalis sphaerospora]
MASNTRVVLKSQRYGKDRVRLVKVIRGDNGWQDVVELTVRVLLEGDFETSYTHADNSLVVATDSMKNTVYVLAKQSNHVGRPELFAQELGRHFLDTYSHVSTAHVRILQHRWARMNVQGRLHPHSFRRDGDDKRVCEAHVSRTDHSRYRVDISSGISQLLVLKTTGSSFTNFVRDRFTTLPETTDRILSTVVEAEWRFHPAYLTAGANAREDRLTDIDYDEVYQAARNITLNVFAEDNSASVQATLYRMAQQIIEVAPDVDQVYYALPNKHVFTVNLEPFGLKNTGSDATIFMPFDDPSGLITATVVRKSAAKL